METLFVMLVRAVPASTVAVRVNVSEAPLAMEEMLQSPVPLL